MGQASFPPTCGSFSGPMKYSLPGEGSLALQVAASPGWHVSGRRDPLFPAVKKKGHTALQEGLGGN